MADFHYGFVLHINRRSSLVARKKADDGGQKTELDYKIGSLVKWFIGSLRQAQCKLLSFRAGI